MQNQQIRIPIPPELANKIEEAKNFIFRADVSRIITKQILSATKSSAIITAAASYLGNPTIRSIAAGVTAAGLGAAAVVNGYERICRQHGISIESNVERKLNRIVERHDAAVREARARIRAARAREARAAREDRARAMAREANDRERRALKSMTRKRGR